MPQVLLFYIGSFLYLRYFKAGCNINELWLSMFYNMAAVFKITQWQQCSICWQKAGYVEIFIVLNKTINQVR